MCFCLPHIDYRGLSHDKVIDSNVPCEAGFLRRVKHPAAIRSAYVSSLWFWRLLIVIEGRAGSDRSLRSTLAYNLFRVVPVSYLSIDKIS